MLPCNDLQRVSIVEHYVSASPAGNLKQESPVSKAAGMRQQVINGDRCAVLRKLGNILANVIRQGQLAVAGEYQYGDSGKLLRYRANFKDG